MFGGSRGFSCCFIIIILLFCALLLFVQFNTNYKCVVKNGRTSMEREMKMFQNNDEHRCFFTVVPQNNLFNLQFKNASFYLFVSYFLPIVMQDDEGTMGAKGQSLSQLYGSGGGVTSHSSHQFIATQRPKFSLQFSFYCFYLPSSFSSQTKTVLHLVFFIF